MLPNLSYAQKGTGRRQGFTLCYVSMPVMEETLLLCIVLTFNAIFICFISIKPFYNIIAPFMLGRPYKIHLFINSNFKSDKIELLYVAVVGSIYLHVSGHLQLVIVNTQARYIRAK